MRQNRGRVLDFPRRVLTRVSRIKRRTAAVAVGTSVAMGFALVSLISEGATLQVCNVSPYATEHVVLAATKRGFETLKGWFVLGVGECAKRSKRFWWIEPDLYVHTRVPPAEHPLVLWVNDAANAQLLNDTDAGNDENVTRLAGNEIRLFGELGICAARDDWAPSADLYLSSTCTRETHQGVMAASKMDDAGARWYFNWQHPNVWLTQSDFGSAADQPASLAAAKQLRASIETQRLNEREWGAVTPFSIGGRLVDENGPLALGVWVTDVPNTTLFGQPMPIQSGDIVLYVNGEPVLGERDLNHRLIQHGLSRSAGIEVPVEYSILRDDQRLLVSAPYFFNEQFRKADSDQSGIAFWFGVGDALTFGQTPWVTCHGSNGIRSIGKGLSKVAELLASSLEGRSYDAANEAQVEYIDAKECIWQKQQARAFARQKADAIYINSQWFALVTPSAFRVVGSGLLRASRVGQVGRTARTGVIATGALEAVETALWSVGTAAPGTPIGQRLGEAAKVAPLGAAGGILAAALRVRSRSTLEKP